MSTLAGDDTYRTLYSVNVGTLAINDLLIVFSEAQLEAAGAITTSQRLSARLLRVDSTGALGLALDEPNAFNISSDGTIGTPVKVATVAVRGAHRPEHRSARPPCHDRSYGR